MDSAVLLVPEKETAFGKEYSETLLERIRVCYSRKISLGGMNTQIVSGGTLYFDKKRSLPQDVKFSAGMRLKIGENSFRIAQIKEIKSEGEIHHYEIVFV